MQQAIRSNGTNNAAKGTIGTPTAIGALRQLQREITKLKAVAAGGQAVTAEMLERLGDEVHRDYLLASNVPTTQEHVITNLPDDVSLYGCLVYRGVVVFEDEVGARNIRDYIDQMPVQARRHLIAIARRGMVPDPVLGYPDPKNVVITCWWRGDVSWGHQFPSGAGRIQNIMVPGRTVIAHEED